jgi:hypothetical protein
MKNGILVKFSKNMKIWRLLVINIITFSTMGSFNSQPIFYKKNQNSQLEIPNNCHNLASGL